MTKRKHLIQGIARRKPSGEVNYFFADHLGSSRIVTNSTGTIVEDSDYYPFGGERVVVNNDPSPYKFTGKERDTESGLDYFVARYYSSGYGRFLSPDEFTGGPVDASSASDPLPPGPLPYADITNPQSLNKYTYTYNNPLNYTDLDGHCPICLAVWVGIEIGLTAYDAYDTGKTLLSSESSATEKKLAVGGFLLGVVLPGGGYGKLARVVHEFGEKALLHAAASSKVFANALQGGKHFGFLAGYATRSVDEIQSGINSFGKQIAKHQDKINNPEKYIKNWNKLSSKRQALLKEKWQRDVERLKEQKEILEKLKKLKEGQVK